MKFSLGFLLVRVRPDGWRWPLVLPLPLFVFEEALEAVATLLTLGVWIGWRPVQRLRTIMSPSRLAELTRLPALLLRTLRSYGPLVLAEVKDGRTYVSVRII